MTARPNERSERPSKKRIRVATKYPRLARNYYQSKGVQVEIIKLYGAMELAPLVGLADEIVDLVETGSTLKANNLSPHELVAEVSCRLIANAASMRTQHTKIEGFTRALSRAVEADHAS
jgi:ATP phosphoribosyltransferase